MKKIVIALDSFKDSLTAHEACNLVEKAFKKINKYNSYLKLPISDGGEGLIDILTNKTISVICTGPLGNKIQSKIGILDDSAIIEIAKASGIELLKYHERNPYNTTTYGIGELITKALDLNYKKIIVGLGGSATNDLGIGLLQALGVKFYDNDKKLVGMFGKDLFNIESVDYSSIDPRLKETEIIIASDVSNSLLGDSGATMMFGIQKGLDEKNQMKFEKEFIRLSDLFNRVTKKNFINFKGSGASGGIGYGLLTFTNARLMSGFDVVSKILKFEDKLQHTDILITGEGKIDKQTSLGKAPYKIACLTRKISPKVKIYGFAGILSDIKDLKNFDYLYSINNEEVNFEENIKNAKTNIYRKALEVGKDIL